LMHKGTATAQRKAMLSYRRWKSSSPQLSRPQWVKASDMPNHAPTAF
jgi:hypothetical protein